MMTHDTRRMTHGARMMSHNAKMMTYDARMITHETRMMMSHKVTTSQHHPARTFKILNILSEKVYNQSHTDTLD